MGGRAVEPGGAVPLPLLLFLLGGFALPGGCSGSHSLRYFYTAVSEPGPGLPQFTVVGYLDDQLFFQFDSAGKQARPRAPWMQAEGPEYWDRQTWIARGWQEAFNGNVRIAMERYNQSGGQHTFQYAYGCWLPADGSSWGFRRYGYDGQDFLSYDTHTHNWVAPSNEAQLTKGKMESDRHLSQQQRDYLEHKCVEWLRTYLGHGKETLQRRERPAVRVTSKDTPGGPSTLTCRAHGFYPREIGVGWLRNGASREQETLRGGVVPSGDGTYHAWATVQVDPQERSLYRCQVVHKSLEEPLNVKWETPPSSVLTAAIAGAVAGTVLLVGILGVFLWWRRRSAGAKGSRSTLEGEPAGGHLVVPVPASTQGSNSSVAGSEKGSSNGSDRGYDSSLQELEIREPLVGGPGETDLPPSAEPFLSGANPA
ncbi:major histocompatibility complex class I-related protein 1-like isoform X2 [Pelodiscus sinensis]|uniref:major histocompatibility complex class I-related protein 1-like isoform X2 n=1 Tax=Pelodiscus sinensis TaxID=13735 RepID=UPI003F6D0424